MIKIFEEIINKNTDKGSSYTISELAVVVINNLNDINYHEAFINDEKFREADEEFQKYRQVDLSETKVDTSETQSEIDPEQIGKIAGEVAQALKSGLEKFKKTNPITGKPYYALGKHEQLLDDWPKNNWHKDAWFDFNPKSIKFLNPAGRRGDGQRGFGGNHKVDGNSGAITLDFYGIQDGNYFTKPPKLMSTSNENSITYEITEYNPRINKTETYLINIEKVGKMNFLCGGGKIDTTLEFGNNNITTNNIVRKPVIYLYSPNEDKLDFKLKLDYAGKIISQYPTMQENSWSGSIVSGSMLSIKEKEYSYLFWEGSSVPGMNWDISKGFCVAKENYENFLEEALDKFAFSSREKTDFITYWLPDLQQNEYSLISFPIEQYSEIAKMDIAPKPKQVIRLFMVFKKLLKPITIEAPTIKEIKRKTNEFHVVEWGGLNLG